MAEFLVPYVFTAGTKAKAGEVNANFTACKTAIDANTNDIEDINESLESVLVMDGSIKSESLQKYKTVSITAATNATPIVITASNHGRSTGDVVFISGILGNIAANGSWTITKVSDDSFSLNGSVGNGSYISDGIVYLLPSSNEDFAPKKYVDRTANTALPVLCVNNAPTSNLLSYNGAVVYFATPFTLTDKNGDTTKYTSYPNLTISPTKYINVVSSGTTVSSGDYSGQPASNAFDSDPSTSWSSSQTGQSVNNTAYIGKTYAINTTIDAIYVNVSQTSAGNVFGFALQEYDGSTWTTIYSSSTCTSTVGSNFTYKQSRTAKGWRVLCIGTSATDGNFICFDLKLLQKSTSGTIYLSETQNIFDEYGIPKAYMNTFYKQSSQPSTPVSGDIWQNNLQKPLLMYKYNGTTWDNYNGVPIGYVVTNSSGYISSVATLPYNQNSFDININSIKSYSNGASWYRIHPDGFIEQGGQITSSGTGTYTLSFLVQFTTTNYGVFSNYNDSYTSSYEEDMRFFNKLTGSCSYMTPDSHSKIYVWRACGY